MAQKGFLFISALLVFIIFPHLLPAENIDPGNDGSQFAWGENVGWLNHEPGGDGGPGVEVTDANLTGFIWGENIGWCSLSCSNTGSCGTINYGVENDGSGALSGFAWCENVGWFNFSPSGGGVTIDPGTGVFTGLAWGENIGWINYTIAAGVETSWRADADADGHRADVDCDDNNPAVHPNAVETCNDIDDNCDGNVDEGFDADSDGYTTCGGDCDDTAASVNPEATETCNDVDDNCDSTVDEGFDVDGDGVKCVDNCPDDFNPDQRDGDSQDGGDVCDICADDPTDTCNVNRSAGDSISPSGGSLATPDGSVAMTLPPGALTDDTSISITDSGNGTLYTIDTAAGSGTALFGVSIQPEGLVFNSFVTIEFTWQDSDNNGIVDGSANIMEDDLRIFKNGVAITGRCADEPLSCDTVFNTLTVGVLSFSDFVLASVNDPPVAVDDAYTTDEDVPLIVAAPGVLVNDTDVDGDPLTAVQVSGTANGTLTLNADGSFDYTPDSNFNGTDSFTYKADDGTDQSEVAFVSIDVVAVNDAPVVNAGPYDTVNEGEVFTGSGSFTDPDETDTWTATVDYGDGTAQESLSINPDKTFTLNNHVYADEGTYAVTVTVDDGNGGVDTSTATVTVNNVAPTVGPITAPVAPVPVITQVDVSADFTDPGSGDTHTGSVAWGDGTTSPGTISETGGSGTAAASHIYSMPGVYTVTLTVTDDDGGSGQSIYQFIVVYDPAGGFVTGGGWIDSPTGAYTPNPLLTGKATFGFVSKYKKGANGPTGNTEFQFKVANLNFKSTSYEWLVISGAKAQFKGSGIINGAGNYGFMLTAIDGAMPGGGGIDKFRIKIWDKNNSDVIVYDNKHGSADDSDDSTELGGGSIVIHKGK